MKKTNSYLSLLATVFISLLLCVSLTFVNFPKVFEQMACFSVAAAMPDGVYESILEVFQEKESLQTVLPDDRQESIDVSIQNSVSNEKTDSISVAVDEVVMGNIIKKTLSPYSVNTKSGNVYVNNQCSQSIDIVGALNNPLEFEVAKGDKPQILIYHTHTTEAFMQSEEEYYTNTTEPRTTDSNKNIVAVGEKIAKKLEAAGYSVIHDTTVHDHPGFSGSYTRSAETVKKAIEKYPTIKVAIDIHRDSISSGKSDKIAPVVNVNGKDAAQVMLVMGSQTGSVTDYPNWRQNLQLALKLQNEFESKYPQLARAVLLRSAKYNQNLTTGSILIEVGSDANTLEQALYSGELVGDSLVSLFDK